MTKQHAINAEQEPRNDEEYYVIATGFNFDGDPIPHTPEHPFCLDMTCPDKEDPENIAMVAAWVNGGLMTAPEADRYYRGRTI